MTFNEDYINAVVTRVKPKPDNLKLMITAAAASLAMVLFAVCVTAYFWDGVFRGLPTVPLNQAQAEGRFADPVEMPHRPTVEDTSYAKPENHSEPKKNELHSEPAGKEH